MQAQVLQLTLRGRLSWLWFIPFAYYPLGEASWPAGDARRLGIALAATLVILTGSLIGPLRATRKAAREALAKESASRLRPKLGAQKPSQAR